MMKQVTFAEERRGYDKEQVEKYISLLQNAIEELEQESQKKEAEHVAEISEKRTEAEITKKEITALKEQLASQEREYRGTCQLLQNTVDKLEREAAEKEESLSGLQRKNSELHNKIRNLERQTNSQPKMMPGNGLGKEERDELLRKVEKAEKERSISQKEKEELKNEKETLQRELEKTRKEMASMTDKVSPAGIEELFVQAKASADAYVQNIQRQVQEERTRLKKENEKMLEDAKVKAGQIIEEARAVKQAELDEKLKEINRMEEERRAEMAELLQNARDELESAQAEAQGARNQSQIILEQAKKRRDKIIARAQEKAVLLSDPIKTECDKLKREMEETAERFAKFYRELNAEPQDHTEEIQEEK